MLGKAYPALGELYRGLHQHPELSLHEEKTSVLMAQELQKLGYTVTDHIGGFGVAGILKNGKGPTVLIRTDMDALPIEEKTSLPYASKARGVNAVGADVPVMHACGHDVHMTVFIGTAKMLAETQASWSGTLVFVAQPSEENGFGAEAMFKDSLYQKIPYPDFAIALHNHAQMQAGTIGYNDGPFMASVDMVNITVKGIGGHGAAPHQTIDPIVLSAQMIMAFQTIVSREINPLESAVVTVGSIHGGSVHNIIPDEVKLQLTVRSYSPQVRAQILSSLERKALNLARQAGLTEEKFPVMTINEPRTPATINDKTMTDRLVTMLSKELGKENVLPMPPSMVGEDFSRFGLQEKKVPISMFWLGTVEPATFSRATMDSIPLPTLHSSVFAPLPEPTIKTGIKTLTLAALELLKKQK
jgi:amidohydrolase